MENANRKKKKLVLLMLVFLIPVSLLFYMLLSGKDSKNNLNTNSGQNAFNDKLPAANSKDNGKNKLEIYMQAQKDSDRLKDQEKQDPYAKKWFDPTPTDDAIVNNNQPLNLPPAKFPKWNKEDVNEKKVNDRIGKLMEALNNGSSSNTLNQNSTAINPLMKNDEEIERLEKMLGALQNSDTSGDPEMKRLESMLDKILDIQHPDRVKERMQKVSKDTTKDVSEYAVGKMPGANQSLKFFTDNNDNTENAFWGLSSPITSTDNNSTFLAVVHENQKIQDGQTVKLRLLQNVFVNSIPIPKGQFIFGKCRISDGRVNIDIQDITYNNRVFPVKLKVYDQTDGIEGINIQGDMTEQVSKDGMDQLIQQMQLNSMTSSIGVQAATSGMQTAKNLLSRKVKKITVTLKAGHTLLLKPIQS